MSIEAVDLRRRAILAILEESPGLNQRDIARRAGCSQRTVGRDLIAMTRDPDSARAAAPQPVPPHHQAQKTSHNAPSRGKRLRRSRRRRVSRRRLAASSSRPWTPN